MGKINSSRVCCVCNVNIAPHEEGVFTIVSDIASLNSKEVHGSCRRRPMMVKTLKRIIKKTGQQVRVKISDQNTRITIMTESTPAVQSASLTEATVPA